ncbi:hypothetical protein DPMN_095046 [Dreissena polymorpha]|uniref:Uncharacterized protein n=1 Tax=Dreissena polymorpha TaxID=45954 RepID=A0A9D4L8Q6_DREPO|nr:hypothetical protein DPMN_095046 [Dreissena polymorpha]
MSDPLAGFVIVRMKNGATNQDQISFRVDVLAATSAIDVECDLYIGYSAAESAAFLRYPTTSVASPTTSVAAPTTSIAAPTTATTAAKTPSCTVPVSRERKFKVNKPFKQLHITAYVVEQLGRSPMNLLVFV